MATSTTATFSDHGKVKSRSDNPGDIDRGQHDKKGAFRPGDLQPLIWASSFNNNYSPQPAVQVFFSNQFLSEPEDGI